MTWSVRGLPLVLVCVAAVPALAQDKAAGKPSLRPDQDLTPLTLSGEATGRLVRVHSASSLTLELAFPTDKPVVRVVRGVRTVVNRPTVTRKQYILDVADDVQVRAMQLPMQFDDMGKPKKYTSEEIKELRGTNARLPGYKRDYDSLRPGQIVTVSFRQVQPAAPAPVKQDEQAGDKKAQDKNPRVTLIVIQYDGDSAARKDGDSDKKKKPKDGS